MKLFVSLLAILGVTIPVVVANDKSSTANEDVAEVRNLLLDAIEAVNDVDESHTVNVDGQEKKALAAGEDIDANVEADIEERHYNWLTYKRWCDPKFKKVPFHPACVTRSKNYKYGGVPRRDRQQIIYWHNMLRGDVSPRASDMLALSWDNDLAVAAQAWAETCSDYAAKPSSMIIRGKFRMGQNRAQGRPSWYEVINAWFNERNHFGYGAHYNTRERIEHYTAMVWAKTYKIGCGFAVCGRWKQRFYVCNYGPEGNKEIYKGQIYKPYKEAKYKSCGQCKLCHSNLCYCLDNIVCKEKEKDSKTCQCSKPLNMEPAI